MSSTRSDVLDAELLEETQATPLARVTTGDLVDMVDGMVCEFPISWTAAYSVER